MEHSISSNSPDELFHHRWQAVIHNDAAQDNMFFYAVKSTGIFCRPSCKSRPPKPDNLTFFDTAAQAIASGFRPCKRCKPTGSQMPDKEWVTKVTTYIEDHYASKLTLRILADYSHSSPYHLQRTFKRIIGITPMAYIQQIRIKQAQALLTATELSILEVSQLVGLPNTPYFITLFKKVTGLTPSQYRTERSAPN